MILLCFILFLLEIAFWFYGREYDVLFGVYGQTSVVKRSSFMVLTFILILSSLYISGATHPAEQYLPEVIRGTSMFKLLLSSIIVLCLLSLFNLQGSVLYSFLGALAAYFVIVEGPSSLELNQILSFVAAPLMAFLLSSLFRLLLRWFFAVVRIHLVHLSNLMRLIVILAFTMTALSFGYNWGGFMAEIGRMMGVELSVGVVVIVFGLSMLLFLPFKRLSTDEPSGIFADFSIYAVASVGFSVALTLLFFSFESTTSLLGLKAVPLSASSLVFMAVAGAELSQKTRLMQTEEYVKELVSFVAAPLGAFAIAYVLMYVVGGNPRTYVAELVLITVAVIVILALIFAVYARNQRRQKLAVERLVYTQQQQIYENSRALNDMELKVVISENQALHNAVQMKRQEVMNAALSIVEQKEYLESLKEIVKRMSSECTKEEMDELVAELNASLNQRLSYERDVDSQFFYAQAESVHEDFNAKLAESFPNLTPQERRLATLLRLGFSSKYIATLMSITTKSVEISRYRLRQKLGLDKGANLVNFIKSI